MYSLVRRILAVGSSLFLLSSAVPVFAQVGACGTFADLTDANKTIATNVSTATGEDFASFTCQNVSDATARSQRCMSGLCAGPANVVCCAPGTGGTAGSAGVGDPAVGGTAGGGGFLQLQLPSCISDGNCSLDDIVRTGVNFANLLFGLSGAVLLATFVYGGVLYLTAGSSGNVSKAKDMIKNALIGMILVFGAGLLVSTVYDTFRSDAAGEVDACASRKPGFSCQYLTSSPSDAAAMQAEMERRVADLCGGDATRRCCPDPGATP